MPTKGAQGRESMELRSPRPQQGSSTPGKDGAGQGEGQDPNSEPKRVAGVKRVSEQRKSQNCQNQQILPGLETWKKAWGTSSRRNPHHTALPPPLKNPQPSCLMWPHSRRTELSVLASVQTEHKEDTSSRFLY